MNAQGKNAVLEDDEVLDLDSLEIQLNEELESSLSELEFLKEEKEQIGSPDVLGETIKNVVWEQFLNQIAVIAGEDFINENRGLTLDLRPEAHIQTTKNFENGKIASHNTEIDYQKRYDDWQSNFQKDPNAEHKIRNFRYNKEHKVWEKYNTRSDSWKKVLKKDSRADFDKGRPTGSNTVNTQMDHTVPAGEIIRDPAANAHMTRDEQLAFANSEKNLNLMDSGANQSKGDSTMTEFLDSDRNGQKLAERFDIDEEALRNKDKEAREEYEKQKKEAEERSMKAGKKSQKEEAFRIGGKALRAVVMQLLAELVKEIIGKLIKWFKETKKSIDTLIESLKIAIKSFVSKLKIHIVNSGNTLLTNIVTAITGPVVRTIKKIWILLKQVWKSLKEAVSFLKDPKNKNMPISLKLFEVCKIVMAGLSGVVALVLGDFIEKVLMEIPVFAVEIPLLGSLANIVGIFMGAVVAGIFCAIAINLIDKATEKKRKQINSENQVEKANEILTTQKKMQVVNEIQLENAKGRASSNISDRHKEAGNVMKEAYSNIMEEFVSDFSDADIATVIDEEDIKTNGEIDKISDDLDDLLNSLD